MASPSGLSSFTERLGRGLELVLLRFSLSGESPLRSLSVELGALAIIKRGMDIQPDAGVGTTVGG